MTEKEQDLLQDMAKNMAVLTTVVGRLKESVEKLDTRVRDMEIKYAKWSGIVAILSLAVGATASWLVNKVLNGGN